MNAKVYIAPVMWADPLLPINISIASTSSSIDRLPAVGVSVNNRIDMQEPLLTEQGMLLKSVIDTDAAPTILRSMLPVKGMKDTSAMICLMELSRRTGVQAMTDEAPLIRLGLLMHCLAPVEWLAYSTSCIQNMAANGYADISKATRTWTPSHPRSRPRHRLASRLGRVIFIGEHLDSIASALHMSRIATIFSRRTTPVVPTAKVYPFP